MNKIYEVYLVSDSTGETLDRIFLALQAQFLNFKYRSHQYAFTRTENQILKILDICKKKNCNKKPHCNELLVMYTLKNSFTCDILLNDMVCFG